MVSETKTCSKCKRDKALSEFHKDKSKKSGRVSQCKECLRSNEKRREYTREYSAKNKDYYREKHAEWRAENKEHLREKAREYRRAHPELSKQYYAANREDILKRQKEWRDAHPDLVRAHRKKWKENNPEKVIAAKRRYWDKNKDVLNDRRRVVRLSNRDEVNKGKRSYYWDNHCRSVELHRARKHKRRAFQFKSGGGYSIKQLDELLIFFDNRCAYTGEPLPSDYHLDHVVPLSKGGTSNIWNLVPCSPDANQSKHAKRLEEWYVTQPYYSKQRLSLIKKWMVQSKQSFEEAET